MSCANSLVSRSRLAAHAVVPRSFKSRASSSSAASSHVVSPDSKSSDSASGSSESAFSSNPYSRVRDAFEPLFASSAVPVQPPSVRPRRQQRQTLSNAEAASFASLLEQILPKATGGADVLDAFRGDGVGGLSKIQKALSGSSTAGSRRIAWDKKAKHSLSLEEEERLDEMREKMVGFESDLSLLQWSMQHVFGYQTIAIKNPSSATVFPDPRTSPGTFPSSDSASNSLKKTGPSSPLYSELLLILFLLLRDTHRSPHAALHIFSLASLTPLSYVVGCTSTLYNEVLRTRWMEGDVETVCSTLEHMRMGGVQLDEGTKGIVNAIGEAIRIDETRAERRATQSPSPSYDGLTEPDQDSDKYLDTYRFFSGAQIAAWGKMERIIEETEEERARHRAMKEDEKFTISEATRLRGEREEHSQGLERREREDAFFRPGIEGDSSGILSSRGERDGMQEPEERRRNREDRLGYPKAPATSSSSTWGGNREDRSSHQNGDSSYRSSTPSNSPPPSENSSRNSYPQEFQSDRDSYSSRSVDYPRESAHSNQDLFRETYRRASYSRGAFSDRDDFEEPSEYRTPLVREARHRVAPEPGEKGRPSMAQIIDGVIVLPKRPSFANPFKIRRQALTRAEKSRHDKGHPMMAWKKKD